jgi:hypothetical protein
MVLVRSCPSYRPPFDFQGEPETWREMGAEVSLRSLSMERFSGDEARGKYEVVFADGKPGESNSGELWRVWRQEL